MVEAAKSKTAHSPRENRRPRPAELKFSTAPRGRARVHRSDAGSTARMASGQYVLPRRSPERQEAPARVLRRAPALFLERLLARLITILMRGDSAVISSLVLCTGAVCLLGGAYIHTYASVAAQEAQITVLQQDLAAAQAHHQALVQDLAQLRSASRATALAHEMHMVQADQSLYIGARPVGDVDELASAR